MERRIDLAGCVNFRDLGGYPTQDGRRLRWRLLYRSDALHALTPADVARIRDELSVSDIVDLRSSFELANEGRGPLEREPIAFHHTPLFDGDVSADVEAARARARAREQERQAAASMSLGERYVGLMDVARPRITNVVRIVSQARAGALYHCAAGKDRTGVISAVLLGALGVPDELIVADYALSAERIDEVIERVMGMKGYQDTLHEMPADTLHAKPESMEAVLRGVAERWGSMDDYLLGGGLEPEELARLRAKCLEG